MKVKTNNGFSIIEIVTTMAVAGVFVAVGIPSFSNYVKNQRSITQINELVMTFNLARSEAVKLNRHVSVCKSDDGTSCGDDTVAWSDGWIVFANDSLATADTVDAGEQILRVYNGLKHDLDMRPTDLAADFVSYRPTGEASAVATFILCDDRGADHARGMIINQAGRPHVSHTQADDSALTCPSAT